MNEGVADQIAHVQNSSNRKVLLVTLYGNHNYGNILQRLALSRTVESLGFQVTHLCEITQSSPSDKQFLRNLIKCMFIKCSRVLKRIAAILGIRKRRKLLECAAFQEKYIKKKIFTSLTRTLISNPAKWSRYDYALTGSDQVWSLWKHTQMQSEYYYLSFMPREKRVCYAPSFGFKEFPESDYEFHKKGLAGFERLSCREQEMIPMIKRISGKDARLVLDPTLLFTGTQWRAYEKKPDYDVPEKYIFSYFLGEMTPEYMSAVREISGGLLVITFNGFDGGLQYCTAPDGFLWLIDHADFVCTDSFHGTAFAVNFGKNFLAFKRKQFNMENMFGRISGLLDSLNITGHIYESSMHIRPDPVNYDEADAKLNALRESSMNYLRECLK